MNGSSRKKFHGWFYPEQFTPPSFLGSVFGLRQAARVVSRPSLVKGTSVERFVYVGCVHGGNEDIYKRLEILLKYPPDFLIFTGDITGTEEIEKWKSHFYEEKNRDPGGIFGKFANFGQWARTFSKEKREEMLVGLAENSKKLLKFIKEIQKKKTKVFVLEGNWDNPLSLHMIAGRDIKDVFITKKYFAQGGIHLVDKIKTVETNTTLHIFLPYFVLFHFNLVSKGMIRKIKETCKKARNKGKKIVMVGHAEVNWRLHYLWRRKQTVPHKKEMVVKNFGRAIAYWRPDEVIYPHQHGRLRDEKGKLLDINAKYLIKVNYHGIKVLDNLDPENINNREIVTTYIPFGYMAEEEFMVDKGKP